MVKEGFYEDLLFHRVIKNFMIQGGDPDSRNTNPEANLGMGGTDYTIPAEINPSFFHKKGALCAARQADQVNPEKRSSGSQFYIVQGRTYTTEELKMFESRLNQQKFNAYIGRDFLNDPKNKHCNDSIDKYKAEQNQMKLNEISIQIMAAAKESFTEFKFSEGQLDTYCTLGGTPHLDGEYTVFGEVLSGFDVIEMIVNLPANSSNRPLQDIKMNMKIDQ